MGEMYIYDIVGHHLPNHLTQSMNTAKMLTHKTNYEIMVDALEKYFRELGINNLTEKKDQYGPILRGNFQSRQREGLNLQFQKIRL